MCNARRAKRTGWLRMAAAGNTSSSFSFFFPFVPESVQTGPTRPSSSAGKCDHPPKKTWPAIPMKRVPQKQTNKKMNLLQTPRLKNKTRSAFFIVLGILDDDGCYWQLVARLAAASSDWRRRRRWRPGQSSPPASIAVSQRWAAPARSPSSTPS